MRCSSLSIKIARNGLDVPEMKGREAVDANLELPARSKTELERSPI